MGVAVEVALGCGSDGNAGDGILEVVMMVVMVVQLRWLFWGL